ncbi:hypothetical protein FOPG_20146 [Fusarium oxysporum f. sp. conglutinans race 2 54008]|nr:hypothetical protein FOPG_20146 [Fusarium oxysporum f. sp. conglutinans race 2 54008]
MTILNTHCLHIDLLPVDTRAHLPVGWLPLMPMPGYGAPSRPSSTAPSESGKRLPPLRAMEGRPPGPGVPGQVCRSWIREPANGFQSSLESRKLDGQPGTPEGLNTMEFNVLIFESAWLHIIVMVTIVLICYRYTILAWLGFLA